MPGAVCETKLLLSAFLGRLLNAALQDLALAEACETNEKMCANVCPEDQGVHEGAEELLQAFDLTHIHWKAEVQVLLRSGMPCRCSSSP